MKHTCGLFIESLTALCLSLPCLPLDFPLLASMDVRMCELLKFLLCKTAHRKLEEDKEQMRVERGQMLGEKETEQRKEEGRREERREELPAGALLPQEPVLSPLFPGRAVL